MLENFAVFRREEQMVRQVEILDDLRERFHNVYVEDKGDVFNSDLTQAIELGNMLDTALCMVTAGIVRKESRGAHARPYDYPTRDDENFLNHSIVYWATTRRSCRRRTCGSRSGSPRSASTDARPPGRDRPPAAGASSRRGGMRRRQELVVDDDGVDARRTPSLPRRRRPPTPEA